MSARASVAEPFAVEGRSAGFWGMAFLIATEATLFASLLFSYFFLRARAERWPPPGIRDPELTLVWPMTALLLVSTVPMIWADHGVRKGDQRALRLGLLATFSLGAAFLTLQGFEYHAKVKEFLPGTHAYASLFYVITGFHGLHVFVGIASIFVLLVAAIGGRFHAGHHAPVGMIAMYWHFVDVVWIAILSTLYLMPHVA